MWRIETLIWLLLILVAALAYRLAFVAARELALQGVGFQQVRA